MHVIEGGSEGGVERCERTVSWAIMPAKEPHWCRTNLRGGLMIKM
jgi:hypothetical protein